MEQDLSMWMSLEISPHRNKKFDDVFEMQRAIATGIAEAIRTELGIKDTYDFMMQSRRAQTISQESKLARM